MLKILFPNCVIDTRTDKVYYRVRKSSKGNFTKLFFFNVQNERADVHLKLLSSFATKRVTLAYIYILQYIKYLIENSQFYKNNLDDFCIKYYNL